MMQRSREISIRRPRARATPGVSDTLAVPCKTDAYCCVVSRASNGSLRCDDDAIRPRLSLPHVALNGVMSLGALVRLPLH